MAFDDQDIFVKPGGANASDLLFQSMPRLTFHCVDWPLLTTRIAQWDDLADHASEPNPFFESWYLLPALECLPDTNTVKILLLEQDGQLMGLLPIARSPRYYRWPIPNLASWLHANCFCGTPLVRAGMEVPFWREALRWADRNAHFSLFLHLRGMVIDGPLHTALLSVCAAEGRKVQQVHFEARAMLSSQLSSQDYLEASVSTKKRKEWRRQAKRLSEMGTLRAERTRNADNILQWSDAFLELERKGWKGRQGSALASQEHTARMFRAVMSGAAQRGRLERLSLMLDDVPVAMLASFHCPPGSFSFKTAFDERFSQFSPGVLLQQENLAVLDDPQIAWTDSCASADHPMIDHIWRERRGIARLSVAIGGRLRRILFQRIVGFETSRTPPESRA